jgi:hypothetical protein
MAGRARVYVVIFVALTGHYTHDALPNVFIFPPLAFIAKEFCCLYCFPVNNLSHKFKLFYPLYFKVNLFSKSRW